MLPIKHQARQRLPQFETFPAKGSGSRKHCNITGFVFVWTLDEKKQKIVVDYYRNRRMPCPDQAFGVFSVDVFLQAR